MYIGRIRGWVGIKGGIKRKTIDQRPRRNVRGNVMKKGRRKYEGKKRGKAQLTHKHGLQRFKVEM